MWVRDFFRTTEYAKPLRTHVCANNVFLRWMYREDYLPVEERLGSTTRTLRMLNGAVVYLLVATMVVSAGDKGYMDECDMRAVCKSGCTFDAFPDLACTTVDMSVYNGGQVYSRLFAYQPGPTGASSAYQTCLGTAPEDVTGELVYLAGNSEPSARTATCFKSCYDSSDLSDMPLSARQSFQLMDRRNLCASTTESYLLCVSPEDECEQVVYDLGVGEFRTSTVAVLVTVAISVPIQFLFDALFIYTMMIRQMTMSDIATGLRKCGFQMLSIGTVLVHLTMALSQLVQLYLQDGRVNVVYVTYFAATALDQLRNVVFHTLIWYTVARRCGQIEAREVIIKDEGPPEDDFFSRLRTVCQQLEENRRFEILVYALVSAYAVFIMLVLAVQQELSQEVLDVCDGIDVAFLVAFLVEIVIRLLANGSAYLQDPWQFVDTTVVVVSFAFTFQSDTNKTIGMLRLLRLLRLVLVLRKAQADTKRPRAAHAGLSFTTPVDRVMETLKEVQGLKKLPQSLKEKVQWCNEIIVTNKLYDINIGQDRAAENAFIESEVHEWFKMASTQDMEGQNSAMVNKQLGTLLMAGSRRVQPVQYAAVADQVIRDELNSAVAAINSSKTDVQEEVPAIAEEEEGSSRRTDAIQGMVQRPNMRHHSSSPNKKLALTIDPLAVRENMDAYKDTWSFDAVLFESQTGTKLLTILAVDFFAGHDLYNAFEIPVAVLQEFAHVLERGHLKTNPYHTATHAADVLQAFHVLALLINQSRKDCLNQQDMLVGLLAAMMHDFEHPGYSNRYLIRTVHPIAMRYNDLSPLENYHVAESFNTMLTSQGGKADPLQHLTEAQYQQVRKAIIQSVFATDNDLHPQLLSTFKTKMMSKDFPSSTDDKQCLMNMLIHGADIANPTRPLEIYLKWVPRIMEEFWEQGDQEKAAGLPISPYADRQMPNVPRCQLGFLEMLVVPLFMFLEKFAHAIEDARINTNAQVNRAHYVAQIEQQEADETGQHSRRNVGRGTRNSAGMARVAQHSQAGRNGAMRVWGKFKRN